MIEERSNLKRVGKRIDTQLPAEVVQGSATSQYWLQVQFREMYTRTRPGFRGLIPAGYDPSDQSKVISHFDLKGFEYGNWLNQEDRYNYLWSVQIALFDLSKITGIQKVGLGKLVGIAFGARGKSNALAHFESSTNMINITRFHEAKKVKDFLGRPVFGNKTTDMIKPVLFEQTGGMGSLAHEYGHALDYIFGGRVEIDPSGKDYSLTNGQSTFDKATTAAKSGTMRYLTAEIINKLIWEDSAKQDVYTIFYAKMKKAVKEKKLQSYWIRQNEMFARTFEAYIQMKLQKNGIENSFLTHKKYDSWVYPDGPLLKKIEPVMDKLLSLMAKRSKI